MNGSGDRLTFIGHSTALLRLGGTSVLTDPVLRGWIGPLRRQVPAPGAGAAGGVDAVLVSHLHRDHLDIRSLRRLAPGTPVVVPRGAARVVAARTPGGVREIGLGERVSIGAVSVTAVPARHDGRRSPGGPSADAVGFVIEGGGVRAYFAGDTEVHDEMSRLGSLDLALLPVWGWGPTVGPGHLDPTAAAHALTLLRPRVAVPIHWGTFYPLGLRLLRPDRLTRPPLEFAERAAEIAPEVQVRVLQPGEMMEL